MSQTPPPPPPMRVERIEYQPPPPARPGILTAVGVVSIIIASLGILLGCGGVASMIMFGFIGGMSPPRTIPTTSPVVQMQTSRSASGVTTYSYSATAHSTVNTTAMAVFYGVSGVCDFGLAILLMIGGIFVLRDSRKGRGLHLAYAGAKIPVALAEAGVYVWMMSSIFANSMVPGSMGVFVMVSAMVQGAIACAYPVALLIVMNRRSIVEYYQTQLR
jgi:hypothetical protein